MSITKGKDTIAIKVIRVRMNKKSAGVPGGVSREMSLI